MADDTRPITFIVPGQELPEGVSGSAGGGERGAAAPRGGPGRVKKAVRVGALRASGEPQRLEAVPGEDVVALHIAGGPVLMLHPESARDLMLAQAGAQPLTRGGTAGEATEVQVSAQLRWRGSEAASSVSRGLLGDVLLHAVEVLTGFAKDQATGKAADFAASLVVKKVDGQVDAGLYPLAPERLPKLKGQRRLRHEQGETAPAADQPLLVFVHGTFVESTSTFGKLWALHPSRVRDLFKAYGGRVYALEHETLGKSPPANALVLAQALPKNARVHLVTHSRGGLVAEVLARVAHQRAVSAAELARFATDDERADLKALATELATKQIRVERVVRVACPARGTYLAAKRLDAYLSVLKWSIELLGVPVVPELVDFLAEVARRRADPSMLPGLAAMIPGSPLVEWLNAPPGPIAGELRVVAGDLEGDSVGSWLKTLLADAYYWTDNDIVVQTRSMYAGAPRSGGASFLLDQGGRTTHFAYFANPRSVDAVVDGLILDDLPAGFAQIGPLSWAGKDAGGWRGLERDPSLPAVFVLPGILGSNLKADGHRIWLGLRLIGGLDRLAYQEGGADGVLPDGPISLVYGKLIEHLAATHEVRPFAFDWRRPIEEEAQRLAEAVEAALAERQATRQPVRIIAHSMGGLVARTMQIVAPKTWERMMAHEGARLVMLGTPNGGSYAPMQVLSGDDTFGNALAAFGSPLADRRARMLMAGMPGLLQLQAGLREKGLDKSGTWAQLAADDYQRVQANNWWHRHAGEALDAAYEWGVPSDAVLAQAVALREKLDDQRDNVLPRWAAKLLLVVGRAKSTPVDYRVDEQDGFVYLNASDGDGRVPLASALLPGVRTWRLDEEHGSLPSAKDAFAAFTDLLAEGSTKRLLEHSATRGADGPAGLAKSRPSRMRKPPRPARGEDTVFSIADADAAAAAEPAAGTALAVSVLNGSLTFVAEPLILGHYRSGELTGTEYVVNRLLRGDDDPTGPMQAALAMGLYPDAVGSHRVFMNTARHARNPWQRPRPHGVVVAGLGDEGALRELDLVTSVRQAVLAWAQRSAEDRGEGHAGIAMAATLLGSGGIGISPGNAARAIARGVREANLELAVAGWPQVTRLTLVELYHDRAAEAWQGLQVLAAASPAGYSVAAQLRFGPGAIRRRLDGGYRGAAYDLITALSRGDETIEFALDSRRARTELRSQPTQIGLVRDLVQRAATSRNDDPGIGRTLFQLLVPLEMEPFLGGADRMVLDLDRGAAAIPWELLDAGARAAGHEQRPWALRSQLMRRLRIADFRPAPRDGGADDDVLIIGEPLLDADSGYPPLPAANEEALVVQEALTQRGIAPERVRALVDAPSATEVVSALLERPWRIVHIAGHGESLKDGGRGVVLSNKRFLGPREIRAMRTVPELVFMNCCHLGAWSHEQVLAGANPPALAASVAEELIKIGVRCVVVAGWAVEDRPAFEFARHLYRALLRGEMFIDALSAAREACWLAAPQGKTWAAYQCYGDPGWRLRARTSDAQSAMALRDEYALIASPVGLALALETLATETRYLGRDKAQQTIKLRQLEERFGATWQGTGAVAEAFGVAWEAVDDVGAAIGWYDRAVKANDASASYRAGERLHNLRARSAWLDAAKQAEAGAPAPRAAAKARGGARRARAAPAAPAAGAYTAAGEHIGEALAGLQRLVDERCTAERLNLLGSAHKRRAFIEARQGHPERWRSELAAAMDAYRRAAGQSQQEGLDNVFYPALNCLAIAAVLDEAVQPRLDAATLAAARTSLEAKNERDPDFWSQVGAVELGLYEALAAGRLADDAPALARGWAAVHARVSNAVSWGSVAEQTRFVLGPRMAGSGPEARAARALIEQLDGYAKPAAGAAVSSSASSRAARKRRRR
jgi:triacylglycerol esterase/lipase EstA (alpha/beta hydrolase family)